MTQEKRALYISEGLDFHCIPQGNHAVGRFKDGLVAKRQG